MSVGIDEAGRGPLAGPLAAAAVVLNTKIKGLNDSKLLDSAERKELCEFIRARAQCVGIGWASPGYIDSHGLTKATTLAMKQALNQIKYEADDIIIDGNFNYLKGTKGVRTIIGADGRIPEVSAASIIAKVSRDEYMKQVAKLHPEYHFHTHVGYSTRRHKVALSRYGLTSFHRKSFKPVADLV